MTFSVSFFLSLFSLPCSSASTFIECFNLIVSNFDLATGRKTKDKQGRTKFDRCEDIYLCEYSSSQPDLVRIGNVILQSSSFDRRITNFIIPNKLEIFLTL